MGDLAASPTPYHAVAQAVTHLVGAGFRELSLTAPLPPDDGRYFIVSGGGLVAWVNTGDPGPFTIVGTHTDSPNLRIRANPDITSGGWSQLGVETYGGLLLNSWLDRDLGLAGRVLVQGNPGTVTPHLVRIDEPILRVPQLAIHLDREIREKGLKLNPQTQLTPLWALAESEADRTFVEFLATHLGVDPQKVLSWDMMAFDTQPPAIVGRDANMIASARIDNLFSTFCAVQALTQIADTPGSSRPALVLYDHEEIGSESSTGAAGSFLSGLLERISAASGLTRSEHLQAMAGSFVLSVDGAHATHPNYVDKHEPSHHVVMNGGVVIKRNANLRYATDAISEARFREICARAEIPVQTYVHRNDLPCGSTIGPVTSAELAISTIDIGAPQLAMHSIRELAGVEDADHLTRAIAATWLA